MILLCTVPEAKAQIGLDHDLDDAMVEEMIEAASGAVINYLKGDADRYLDSSGNLGTDTSITDPPDFAPVKRAAIKLTEIFYNDRNGGPAATWPHGYLPPIITSILYPLRNARARLTWRRGRSRVTGPERRWRCWRRVRRCRRRCARRCAVVVTPLRSITSPLTPLNSETGQMMPALAPWADVLFASDAKWWRQYETQGEGLCGPEVDRQQRSALAGGEAAAVLASSALR